MVRKGGLLRYDFVDSWIQVESQPVSRFWSWMPSLYAVLTHPRSVQCLKHTQYVNEISSDFFVIEFCIQAGFSD